MVGSFGNWLNGSTSDIKCSIWLLLLQQKTVLHRNFFTCWVRKGLAFLTNECLCGLCDLNNTANTKTKLSLKLCFIRMLPLPLSGNEANSPSQFLLKHACNFLYKVYLVRVICYKGDMS